jgi:carbon storage regulator
VLVFTRKRDEAIVIGDGIEVRVLRVGRDSVRLGVVAPPAVPVHRLEVYEQIQDENRAAAAAAEDVRTLALRLRRAGEKEEPTDDRERDDAGKEPAGTD